MTRAAARRKAQAACTVPACTPSGPCLRHTGRVSNRWDTGRRRPAARTRRRRRHNPDGRRPRCSRSSACHKAQRRPSHQPGRPRFPARRPCRQRLRGLRTRLLLPPRRQPPHRSRQPSRRSRRSPSRRSRRRPSRTGCRRPSPQFQSGRPTKIRTKSAGPSPGPRAWRRGARTGGGASPPLLQPRYQRIATAVPAARAQKRASARHCLRFPRPDARATDRLVMDARRGRESK